ncbi:hypothetical protein ONE63_000649 [Megalurothrips usitatus]|uniref:Uncharacterized protein n=1 Tax=Megalurothrips usitatus TaxID=439358 RepID=A0AAV7XZ38_9NEOP|nr:hypothetical protein ONE63_000649 [Megalurothrips usitatus]
MFPELGGRAARVRRGGRVQQAGRVREAVAGAAVPLPGPAALLDPPLAQRRPHRHRQDEAAQDVRARQEAAQVPVLPRRDVDAHDGQRHGAGGALPLPPQLRRLPGQAPGPRRQIQVLVRLQPAKRDSPVAAPAVPAQGAVPTVHGAEAAGAPGRGQHQLPVPVPAQPLLPHAPLGPGRHPGQHLRQRADLQRLLPAPLRGPGPGAPGGPGGNSPMRYD